MNSPRASYAIDGFRCYPITSALSSNQKFLIPNDCVYEKQYKEFLYPSTSFPTGNFNKNIYIPEMAKAYYIPFAPKDVNSDNKN